MSGHGYKKYMKKEARESNSFLKIFIISFFGMLLFFTFIIKSLMPSVDTSIGDYKEQSVQDEEEISKKIVDNRLEMIQNEDQGKNFADIMSRAEDVQKETQQSDVVMDKAPIPSASEQPKPSQETVYKVFIGSYTSAEQARVAKDIIIESGNGLNPIVKCIGSNNYTLQVGIFRNKQSAESLLYTIQQSHLPGRIVQE
ncbi:hypothetical protein IKQ21_04470 [bacterium]|nr:hypothetical protein [bacterium]